MQYGAVCKNCPGFSKCKMKPTKAEHILMDCVDCSGQGCSVCENRGTIEIVECPLLLITPDIWELLIFVDFAKKGALPIDGGALDQTENFLRYYRFVLGEQNFWKNKFGIINNG